MNTRYEQRRKSTDNSTPIEIKLVVAGISGTIYDAVLSRTPGIMTGNRTDRTDECISAVAEHMKMKADFNEDDKGFWQYIWPGKGTLTWESAANEALNMLTDDFEIDKEFEEKK